MSFYFDDDNDDNVFSQTFQTSSQKQVSFSQSSSIFPFSQLSSEVTPVKHKHSPFVTQSQELSQNSHTTTTPNRVSAANNKPAFVCQNCGAVDDYYQEDGLITCSNCFTQSQSYGALQEELDYDESQHMAARNRDGTLKRVGTKLKAINADGTARRGRPAVPLEDLDTTKKPPSLEECLGGFQAVLQKSCKILCFELLPTLSTEVRQPMDDYYEDNYFCDNNQGYHTMEQKRDLYRQVSNTVKALWKAYLLSWKEGADFYSKLYPQIRFSLRDQFLPLSYRTVLYRTLAASAQEKLTQQIRKEVEEEEANYIESDSNSDSDSDSDSDDKEKVKVENENENENKKENLQSDDRKVKTEMDSLYDLFHAADGVTTDKIKSEHVVSEEEIPVPDIVHSNVPKMLYPLDSKTSLYPYHSRRRRTRPWEENGNTGGDNNISSRKNSISDDEGNDSDGNHNDEHENCTVASELSNFDAAEHKSKEIAARKRKRMKLRENKRSNTGNTFAKMIYYHNKLMHAKTKSKKIPLLGRKEAALLVVPSMELILGLLLVAAAPHGVTEGKMVEWVWNGSLPILHAFGSLLPKQHQETLQMVASFFTLSKAPDPSVLKFLTRKIHVACGYQAPKVKLQQKKGRGQGQQEPIERILTNKSLSAAGRLVRPSTVPLLLGLMVSELGLSQRVLNYSLALMGLPVSRLALKTEEIQVSSPRKGRYKIGSQADKLEEWDDDDPPEFDLSKPGERLRRKRYLNKLAQRRRRERRRKKLGMPVYTMYRNKKYSETKHKAPVTDDDDVPDFVSSVSSERLDDEIPDFIASQNDEGEAALKKKTEWLPPPLRAARPDKLENIDQILAVVVVACKLIPDWERNHHYVFLRDHCSGADTKRSAESCDISENVEMLGEYGTSGGQSNALALLKAKNRFIPWNFEEFRRIGNGKTESDYLDFLEECIFRGNNYALPKFVESLNTSSDILATQEEDLFKEEETDNFQSASYTDKEVGSHTNDNPAVVPNNLVLSWKKDHRFEHPPPSPTKDKLGRVPYRPTKPSDTLGLRKPDGPLGPLMEYMAYKTGACPDRILVQLIKLDKEMLVKGKPEKPTLVLPPDVCYEHFMGESVGRKSSAKKKAPRRSTPAARSTPASLPPPPREAIPASKGANLDVPLTPSPLEQNNQLGGDDNILTQRSPENDDLSTTASVYAV